MATCSKCTSLNKHVFIIHVVPIKLLNRCTFTRWVHKLKQSFSLFFLAVPGVFGPAFVFLTGLKKNI